MPHVAVNDRRFFYQLSGKGEHTVVFVHGLIIDNLSSWYLTVAPSVSAEMRVLCYDLLGHGFSDRPPTGYSIADMVEDLVGMLDALEITGPVHIVGNSYGGNIALGMMLDHPERVAGVGLVDTLVPMAGAGQDYRGEFAQALELTASFLSKPDVDGWLELVEDFADDDVDWWLAKSNPRKLRTMTATARKLLYETSLIDDVRNSPSVDPQVFADRDIPVVLLYGGESEALESGKKMAEVLPRSELHVMEGLDHFLLQRVPAQCQEILLPWLRKTASAMEPASEQ